MGRLLGNGCVVKPPCHFTNRNAFKDSESLLATPGAAAWGLLQRLKQKVEDKVLPCHLKGIVSFEKLSPSLNLKITLFWL